MRDPKTFFVGYLPISATLNAFYKLLIPIVLVLGLAVSVWLASGQQSAGKATGDLSAQQEVSGYLTLDPYPVLHLVGDEQRSILLVEQTKKSADELLEGFANQWVTLSGFALQRGDWHMLQLPPSSEVKLASATPTANIATEALGAVTFQGEIIDSKCFLGAMKPGGGKVHRACASLCLLGGIPPMLVVKNELGERFGYVLMNEDGSSASIDLSERVAVPVEVSGELIKRGDLQYIRLSSNSIKPLDHQALLAYGDTLVGNEVADTSHDHHHHNH